MFQVSSSVPSVQHLPQTDRQSGLVIALIPAFNEERFIGSMVLAARAYVDYVIVVDDGSADQTQAIAELAGAMVIRHTVNLGKAAAVNTGFAYARKLRPLAMVMLDGDGQHSVGDISAVLAPIFANEADIVLGTRFSEVKSDIPIYRQVGQHGLTLATNLTSGVWVSDSQSGFRAFSQRAIELLNFSKGGFSVESEMQFLIRDHQLRFVEVPIRVIYAEPAKRSPLKHGMQVVNGIMQLVGQARPLLFFSGSGLLILISGFLSGSYLVDMYARTQYLAIGFGLLTMILCVVGVLLFFAGIILHSTRGMILDLRQNIVSYAEELRRQAEPASEVLSTTVTVNRPIEEPLMAIELGK